MITRYTDPIDALLSLQRALDARLSSEWLGRGTTGTGAFPLINVFQRGDDFAAVIELPGLSKNDLDIQVKERSIRISGRKTIEYGEGGSLHRRERVSGIFDRTITLPVKIDPDRVVADYRDGVLSLSITRAESEKPRSIRIN